MGGGKEKVTGDAVLLVRVKAKVALAVPGEMAPKSWVTGVRETPVAVAVWVPVLVTVDVTVLVTTPVTGFVVVEVLVTVFVRVAAT